MKKDVIYIDPEDDITGLIDRVNMSKQPIAALVLPKRAQVLHSSVNMRLLKRAADAKKKRLVLITTEAAILKLAADVRVYVAKSLTSKPIMPEAPSVEPTETISTEGMEDTPVDKKKSIGELAGVAALADGEETIELDNAEDNPKTTDTEKTDVKEDKKDRKLKVPNFDKFRTRLFLGIAAAVALLAIIFMALFVWPKATIVIKTETSDISTKFDFTANTAQTILDETAKIIPAQSKELKQTVTEKFQATGSVDKGNHAKGYVTVANCNKDDQTITMPANSKLIVGDAIFLTDAPVIVPASNFKGDGACKKDITRDVNVTAQLAGDKYNLSARGGYVAPDYVDISGYGSNMTGGTSNVVKAVSQDDVDTATQKILLRNTDADKQQLQDLLKAASQYPLPETFASSNGQAQVTPAVGQEASEGSVTIVITYTMLGVNQKDLEKVMANEQNKQINTSTQKIYNNGLDKATIGQIERKSPTEAKMSFSTTATAGPQLDAQAIAKSVAGKSGGETKQIIQSRPGITSADVQYSPFWVLKTPKRLNRIVIKFDAAGQIQ